MRFCFGLFILVLIIGAGTASQAAWYWPFGDDEGLDFKVKINGVDKETAKYIKKLKLTKPDEKNLPKNNDELSQELVDRGVKIKKAMDSFGYFDSAIEQNIDLEKKTPVLNYKIEPGKQYKIKSVKVIWPGPILKDIDMAALQTQRSQPINNEKIIKDSAYLNKYINKDSCLLSINITPMLKLHNLTKNGEVEFIITHGEIANFGEVEIEGNKDVGVQAINRLIAWKSGECYDQVKVDKTQKNMVESQLFSSIKVLPDAMKIKNGLVTMDVILKERVPRTFSAGADYNTDQGIGTHLGWEHRNFLGNGEKLNAELNFGEQIQELTSVLKIPGFRRKDQTLVFNAGIKKENTDVYKSDSIEGGVSIERRLTTAINSGIGVNFALKNTEDILTGQSNYALLSFPGFLEYDTRNDILDATEGILSRLSITPYTETIGDGGRFIKTQLSGQTYFTNTDMIADPTLALRLVAGSISGQTGENVPSDTRFYAGGSGSVRGYGYQSIGPRLNGKPFGGASLVEGSVELRMHFTDNIGGVLFADGGNVTDNQMPELNEIFIGAGTGIRYYSPIGPLRFDVAVPVNGDKIGQEGYQLYVSIGQAF